MNIWRIALDEKSGAILGQPEAVTTIGAATAAQHLTFSRDGRLSYVAQEQSKNLRRVAFDPVTGKTVGEPLAITQGSMQFSFPDPSPDGQWLTCHSAGSQRHIFIMRTDGSDSRDLTPDAYRYSWPRWSPDGKRLVGIRHMFGGIHAGIGIYDLASRHYDWLTDFGDYPLWLKDNQRILFVSQGKILSFDTKSRKYQPVLLVTNEGVDIGSLGLSADNRMIYFTYVQTQA